MGELPPSDDEESDAEDEGSIEEPRAKKVQMRTDRKSVIIEDDHADNTNKLQRKGTGYVHITELPPSDDEADDEEEESTVASRKGVQIKDHHGDNTNNLK